MDVGIAQVALRGSPLDESLKENAVHENTYARSLRQKASLNLFDGQIVAP